MALINLYHGGEKAVKAPLVKPETITRSNDFGIGFYATTSHDQARRWVKIRIRQHVYEKGGISSYVFNDDALTSFGLKVKVFDGPSPEWFDFVMANRHDATFSHEYDIVKGPVANDNVYETLTLFEDGILSKEEAIVRLRTYQLVDQVFFHSEKALECLAYFDFEEVE